MKTIRRYLGHPDADRDAHFAEHFIASRELRRLSTSDSDIVFGAKGVGKTALRRALTELQGTIFHSHRTVSLDTVSFTQVHEALKDLRDTSRAEIATLARNLWQNVLAVFCLEAALANLPSDTKLHAEVALFLDQESMRDVNPNQQILGVVDRILKLVAELALESQETGALGLNKKQRQILNEFPYRPRLLELLLDCAEEVNRSQKKLALCLDGFDSIVDHTPEARRAIFAGLIDAIHKLSLDPRMNEAFCFKAFLPQELADVARSLNWDADKHLGHTHFVSWGQSELQKFIAKRLAPHSRTKSQDFSNVWLESFPEKVRNSVHKLEENTFSYIVRHTLHRPRQLLEHVQALFDEWDETTGSSRVDPTFIPGVVAKTCKTLADLTTKQLETALPGTQAFLYAWRGQSNCLSLAVVRSRVGKYYGSTSEADINRVLDFLYDFGVLGFANRRKLTAGSPASMFTFGSLSEHLSAGMQGLIEEEDVIALSPMFHNYCDASPSEFGAIFPVPR
jgi:hypothetical protein